MKTHLPAPPEPTNCVLFARCILLAHKLVTKTRKSHLAVARGRFMTALPDQTVTAPGCGVCQAVYLDFSLCVEPGQTRPGTTQIEYN